MFGIFKRIYNRYFSPNKQLVSDLVDLLGFAPTHLDYYRRAFVHRSFASDINGINASEYNNERLEYLGDAVLGMIVGEYLFKKYPNKDEGFLTMMRSKMVNRKALNELADTLEFDVFLRHCGGENISDSMLGNAFEAFIGAVYLDVGYPRTRQFVLTRVLKKYVNVHQLETLNTNYKSQLLEWCQREHKSLEYILLEQFKQSRRDRFRVGVMINKKKVAVGEDFNKKSAEQIASQRALEILGLIEPEATA